jgi:hypothetical protein
VSSNLAPPELSQVSAAATSQTVTHFELRLRSPRGAPSAFVIFPKGANVQDVVVATQSGPLRAKLQKLSNGDTVLGAPGLPSAGLAFGIDAAAAPVAVQVFDQSYGLPVELPAGKALQQARPKNATSSQDGDVTVVQRTVHLDPAAGR